MTKKQFRILYKEKRKELSISSIEKFNDLILIHFQKIELPAITCLHTYVASPRLREVDTGKVIRYLKFKNPGLKVAVPKINVHTGNMQHFHLSEEVKLINNGYGIEEPINAKEILINEIDLVLIPLLAFDKNGYRVGYGKGYYDRFLSAVMPDVVKIGLSFFDAVDRIEDVDGYDIPLNFCVTPHRL
ncbi:MAG: 5-formyltetrahydrofolate cyclo-ligase, partial [Ginsengibacter sp.]